MTEKARAPGSCYTKGMTTCRKCDEKAARLLRLEQRDRERSELEKELEELRAEADFWKARFFAEQKLRSACYAVGHRLERSLEGEAGLRILLRQSEFSLEYQRNLAAACAAQRDASDTALLAAKAALADIAENGFCREDRQLAVELLRKLERSDQVPKALEAGRR